MALPSTPHDRSLRQQVFQVMDCALRFALMTVLLSSLKLPEGPFLQASLVFDQCMRVALLQVGQSLEELLASAECCIAEAEAFLQVAEFTIKEARSRVLYTQPWPSSRQ